MRAIDLHTHGIGGYDTKTKIAEDILKIAEIQGSQGIAEIMPTVYSGPIEEMRANMEAIRQAMAIQEQALVYPKANNELISKIIGIHLEGPFLNPVQCGALDKGSFLQPSEYDFQKLVEGFENIVKIVTVAPELERATNLIKVICNLEIVVSMGHSDATFEEAEAGFQAGAKGVTHIFNAMRGFHHRTPGIVGFGLLNQHVYVEVIADPFHLSPETIQLIFKIKNPKKIVIISDSIKETKSIPVFRGIMDFHGTLQGGSSTIIESVKRLVEMGYEEELVMDCISNNPESYLS